MVKAAGTIFLLALTCVLLVDVRPAIQHWGRVPQQIDGLTRTVELVPGQIAGQALASVVPLIDKHAGLLRRDLFGEVKALRSEVFPRVDAALGLVDQVSASAVKIVDLRSKEAMQEVAGLRSDLKPTLDNSAALVKDARESWDDMYWDVKSMVESATVFTTSGARMADDARAALPRFLALGEEMGKHFSGITEDVHGMTTDGHKITSKFTAPKTKKQKAWGVVEAVLFVGVRVAVAR